MAWGADLTALRGWVVAAIQSVWPDATVAADAPEKDFGPPFVRVVTRELEFHPESVLTDRLEIVFEIRVRRAVATGAAGSALIADAEVLRTALLAEANPAGVGELPLVKKVWIEQGSPGDGEFEMRMEFSCQVSAERGS